MLSGKGLGVPPREILAYAPSTAPWHPAETPTVRATGAAVVSSALGFVQLGQGSQVPLLFEAHHLSRSLSVVPGGQRAAGREGSRLRTDMARSVGFGARTSALIPTVAYPLHVALWACLRLCKLNICVKRDA